MFSLAHRPLLFDVSLVLQAELSLLTMNAFTLQLRQYLGRGLRRLHAEHASCAVHLPRPFSGALLARPCSGAPTGKRAEGTNKDAVVILDRTFTRDEMTNVTPAIVSRVGRNLHHVPHHPVNIMKQRIVAHFHRTYINRSGNASFAHFDDVSPVVTTAQNFDSLLVPPLHVARSKNDNYYVNATTMLRAHTSAHQRDFVRMGFDRFLVTGDVYRRDEIDSSHYPVFHQMEGVRLYMDEELFASSDDPASYKIFESESDPSARKETEDKQAVHTIEAVKMLEFDLKRTLVDLVRELFGSDIESRWNPCYFPFTHPSYELEIKFRGEWLEVLGSGIMRQQILDNGGAQHKVGWAFGLGLDRLAMLLFNIPDIRLLWSIDERFINQFRGVGVDPKTNITFSPFSKFPPCYKDISFWLPYTPEESHGIGENFADNDFFEIVRSTGGDYVEKVELIDKFIHPTSHRVSKCFRITYRSMDCNVTNEEINHLQETVRKSVQEELGVELR